MVTRSVGTANHTLRVTTCSYWLHAQLRILAEVIHAALKITLNVNSHALHSLQEMNIFLISLSTTFFNLAWSMRLYLCMVTRSVDTTSKPHIACMRVKDLHRH